MREYEGWVSSARFGLGMGGSKRVLRSFIRHLGIDVVRYTPPDALRDFFRSLVEWRNASGSSVLEKQFIEYCLANYGWSRSQIFQDLFVQFVLKNKRNGFFVEFGATNGIDLSNSYALETKFGWSGILAEPARIWHDALKRNRTAKIDVRCVWSRTGDRIEFNEAPLAEFSTVGEYSNRDLHAKIRANGRKYSVDSVSLSDLLAVHSAPGTIEYLSIDTEGSEFSILSNFDFNTSINVISVEHNYHRENREGINRLLTNRGYERVFERFSDWDDWYVQKNLIADG